MGHCFTLFSSVEKLSRSPLESSAQFPEGNFCSKDLIPESTAYSKSCNQVNRKLMLHLEEEEQEL
jgi:hypothetical protein